MYCDVEIGELILPRIKFLCLDMAPCVILGSEFLISKACILDFAEHRMDFN